ncbi:MAG TPA: glycosyltransferase family 39 protein [Candidatus Nanoarchaeia archaeon]|nr:glycosyltransferase family 39 protein [Candidatus Nanoarchaeia archaeon]
MTEQSQGAWFHHYQNKILLLLLAIAFAFRLYYLDFNSAVWWDEADYLASAKHWFFDLSYTYNPQRGILFPLLIGMLFKLGLSELAAKFVVVLLPSLGIVLLTYLLGKEMYSKNVGLISAALMSTFWVSLFWTSRFSNDFLALFFQLCAILCFWKGVVKKQSKYYTWSFGFFLALGFLTRAQSLLAGLGLLLFLLLTQRLRFLKNKDLWIATALFFLTLTPYLLWLNSAFGTPLAFSTGYSSQIQSAAPFGWYVLNFVFQFPGPFIFVAFLLGLFPLWKTFLGLDLILKNQASEENLANVFWILVGILTLAFFVFWLRGAEDRWVILLSVPVFIFSAKGALLAYEIFLKKTNQKFATFILLLLVLGGMYAQYSLATPLLNEKKDTYLQVKEAALWMKTISNPQDILYSASGPQTSYYSDREVKGYPTTEEEFLTNTQERKPRYMSLSAFERHPEWVYSFPERHQDLVHPVNAWYADQEQKQPLLVVLEFK